MRASGGRAAISCATSAAERGARLRARASTSADARRAGRRAAPASTSVGQRGSSVACRARVDARSAVAGLGDRVCRTALASISATANSGLPRAAARARGTCRVRRRALRGCAPGDAEQAQPVQQAAALAVGRLAQVEVERRDRAASGLQPQAPLLARRGRAAAAPPASPSGTAPSRSPTISRSRTSAQRRVRRRRTSTACGGLGDLGQPGERPAAQRRQRLGQADRLDDVRRGDVEVLARAAARAARVSQRTIGVARRCVPQVVVPAGRVDAGAVAAA